VSELYDLEADGGWTSRQSQVAEPTEREWRDAYMPRRSAQVAKMQEQAMTRGQAQPGLNPVNGHALDCACVKCPGWYEARARMAVAAQAYAEPTVKPVAPRPLTDQVVPVAILMVVFTLCAVVLLPVVMPFVAMGVALTGFIVVCMCILSGLGLIGFGMVRRAAREAQDGSRGTTVRGRVLRRR
jgi:hypothetical protein